MRSYRIKWSDAATPRHLEFHTLAELLTIKHRLDAGELSVDLNPQLVRDQLNILIFAAELDLLEDTPRK